MSQLGNDFASKLLTAPGILNGKATDGVTIEGDTARLITLNMDLQKLARAKDLRPMWEEVVRTQMKDASLTPTQINAFVDVMVNELAIVAADGSASLSYTIGKDDKQIHGLEFRFTYKTTAATRSKARMNLNADIDFDFKLDFSELGKPFTVEVPSPVQFIGATK